MGNFYVGTQKPKSIYIGTQKVLKIYKDTSSTWTAEEPSYADCLCFTATQAKSFYISLNKTGEPVGTDFKISIDNRTWTEYTPGTRITLSNVGDKVYFRGNNPLGLNTDTSNYYKFYCSELDPVVDVSGNIMSLIDDGACTSTTIPNDYCFCMLFYSFGQTTTAPELPATTLTAKCYYQMFHDSDYLVIAPRLPATTLAEGCYTGMFDLCGNLTTVPELPATTLAPNCYENMFWFCSKLVNIPATLPATTLATKCYTQMFRHCKALITSPSLPATTLADNCYYQMFGDCTSLTTAPALPATTLTNNCYQEMFKGCTSLTTAPTILPATTLANYCYYSMFYGCTSLTTVPELPATTLPNTCYEYMFSGCTSLYVSDAPHSGACKVWKIPTSGSIENGRSFLPESMVLFNNCSGQRSSNSITIQVGNSYTYYLKEESKPLCFTSNVPNATIQMSYSSRNNRNFQTSTDGENWTEFVPGTTTITLANKGDKVYFRGNNANGISIGYQNYYSFKITDSISASGNIMSLIDNGACNTTTIPCSSCFHNLFKGCTGLATPPELPATTLTAECYYAMFSGCTALTMAPELPATTLAEECYRFMFGSCDSLTVAPMLPATTLAKTCYYGMFEYCDSLTAAPELPATTLAQSCYSNMFRSCKALVAPPALPATAVTSYCYDEMFYGCSALQVSNSQVANVWRIPSSNTFTATYSYTDTFYQCAGTRSTNNLEATSGSYISYQTQNVPLANGFTVSYLAGDGIGYCSPIKCSATYNHTLISGKAFIAPTGKVFSHWNINGTSYQPGDAIQVTSNLLIIAIWRDAQQCTVTFDANGGSGTQEGFTILEQIPITMPQCTFIAPVSMKFDKWAIGSTSGTQVAAGKSYTFTENTTVYALWKDSGSTGPLCFTANSANSVVGINKYGTPLSEDFKMSTDGVTWTQLTIPYAVVLYNEGDKVYFKGNNPLGLNNNIQFDSENFYYYDYVNFVTSGTIEASGNIMSLIDDGACTTTVIPGNSCFAMLFGSMYEARGLVTPPELPATTLTESCYANMFMNCITLETPPALPATTLAERCYVGMFSGCKALTTVPELLATTLANRCYSGMFGNCRALQVSDTQTTEAQYAWKIPYSGTFTNTYSQSRMFYSCAGTRAADDMAGEAGQSYTYYTQNEPIKPSSKSGPLCFTAEEAGAQIWLSKVSTPPGTDFKTSTDGENWTPYTYGTVITLENVGDKVYFKGNNPNGLNQVVIVSERPRFAYNYFNMRTGEISASGNIMSLIDDGACIQTAIPNDYCFYNLFEDCDKLISAPELPATTLTESCYVGMFSYCSALAAAPELPATTLAYDCYDQMFDYCTSLTTAPALPATTLTDYCYSNMFSRCTSLTTAPELSAIALAEGCYYGMFLGCTSLTAVPELPATTLADCCYEEMFKRCTSLQVSDTQTSEAQYAWTIPTTGTFTNTYAQADMFLNCAGTRSSDAMAGETGQGYTYYTQNKPIGPSSSSGPLCFTVTGEEGTVVMYLDYLGSETRADIQTSFDGINWAEYTWTDIELNPGDKIYFKGNNPEGLGTSMSNHYQFCFETEDEIAVEASGTVMSLLDDGDGTTTVIPSNYCFYGLFQDCLPLTTAPELPATTLTEGCYGYMFDGCRSLSAAPTLPATNLTKRCYSGMFNECTSLTAAPALSATTLAEQCYQYMFYGCSNLATAPALPATTLATSCYAYMFRYCVLTTPPELPATTLAAKCYQAMFANSDLKVSDAQSTETPYAWTIPTTGTFTNTYAQSKMFEGCAGTRSSDNMAGEQGQSYTYYTQNEPV